MKILLISLALFISGCSGGSDTVASAPSWQPGIYEGSFTETGQPAREIKMIVTSNNEFAIATVAGDSTLFGSISGSKGSTTDGFTATLTSELAGSYVYPGETGTFSLTSAGLYDRSASTGKLEGVWVDQAYTETSGTSTFTIDALGSIDMQSVSGCAGTGSAAVIAATKNEYTINLELMNCTGYNGLYSGYGWLADGVFTDGVLWIVVENTALETYGIFAAVKQ